MDVIVETSADWEAKLKQQEESVQEAPAKIAVAAKIEVASTEVPPSPIAP